MIDRAAFNQGENAQYDPHIEATEVMDPLVARGPHAVAARMVAFGEYADDETASTLKARDYKDATDLIAEPVVMAPSFSKRPGQQIANRQDGLCYAVTTGEPPRVLEPVGERDTHAIVEPVAFTTEQTPKFNDGCALTLTKQSPTGGGQIQSVLTPAMAVRRLTPRECERLQGFRDDHTRIPWRGKTPEDCPDGPRYKACGNSMAVPVIRWIGRRIAAVIEAMS